MSKHIPRSQKNRWRSRSWSGSLVGVGVEVGVVVRVRGAVVVVVGVRGVVSVRVGVRVRVGVGVAVVVVVGVGVEVAMSNGWEGEAMSKRICVVCLERSRAIHYLLCAACNRSITSRGFKVTMVEWAARRARAYQKRRDRKGGERKR